jgi:predicted N-acetyltransferase YhbS
MASPRLCASPVLELDSEPTVACLTDVSTVPEHRGRGYCSHLLRYAMAFAADRGKQHIVLTATPAGVSVYQRLGFQASTSLTFALCFRDSDAWSCEELKTGTAHGGRGGESTDA